MHFTHISRWGFKQQLILAFTLGIFCLALISSLTISAYSSDGLRQQALEQGLKVTESFARQSALALLYESAENAKEAGRLALSFPDVVSVTIFQPNHKVLFSAGMKVADLQQDEEKAELWSLLGRLEGETDQAWYFVAPVFSDNVRDNDNSPFSVQAANPDLIGYTRLVMSKASLNQVLDDVFKVNLYISLLLSLVLLSVLLAITTRVTKPLMQLARAMKRAQLGEKKVRSSVNGPQDIMLMEGAFNTMMDVLEARELELQKARDTA
ncbi:MAG: diguanylate phosphodiesterase, partial [Gammaproteobacteria bacterium]|nr:diguanylate phosphodiesterase [Gammaproteobacteria bacterium]